MQGKCTICGKLVDGVQSKDIICGHCRFKQSIENGTVNYNVKLDNKKSDNKTENGFFVSAVPVVIVNIVLAVILYACICMYNNSVVGIGELFDVQTYEAIKEAGRFLLNGSSESGSKFESVSEIFLPSLTWISIILFILLTAFNLLDLISSVYWMNKKGVNAEKRRKAIRGTAIKWIVLWPVLIYVAMLKYVWAIIKIFLGIDEDSLKKDRDRRAISESLKNYTTQSSPSSSDSGRYQSGFVDASGVWRDPGSGFVDFSGVWRDYGSGFIDGAGIWRDPGSGFVDAKGIWRDPGSGFIDGAGIWRDGKR